MGAVTEFPRHGTRSRYRRMTCRCVACTRQAHGTPMPTQLMWPYKHLEKEVGADRLMAWYTDEQIADWKANGLDDYEADRVAIKFGLMAHFIWPGWTESGLDCDVYP